MLYIQNFIVFQTQQVLQHFLGGWIRQAMRSRLILRVHGALYQHHQYFSLQSLTHGAAKKQPHRATWVK